MQYMKEQVQSGDIVHVVPFASGAQRYEEGRLVFSLLFVHYFLNVVTCHRILIFVLSSCSVPPPSCRSAS